MPERIVIAALRHETNTFSPVATPLESFFDRFNATGSGILAGETALELFEHTGVPFAAFVAAAKARGAEIIVPLYASASPSAPTDRRSFDTMSDAIVASVADGCDAVLLDLHGAMVAEEIDDAEGELLRRIRSVASEVPVGVALDFHSNLSDGFFEAADVVTGYRTYPHVDTYETGERAARTLFKWMDGGARPQLAYRRVPMLTHMNCQSPAREPMKTIMDRAIGAESAGEVSNASVFGGFPLADVPEAGLFVVVVAGSANAATELADELADMAWERREDFVFKTEPLSKTIAEAKGLTEYPIVLAEHGNNCGAGGSVDTMDVYRAVIEHGLNGVIAGPVWDPEAVAQLIEHGVGETVSIAIGGKTDLPAINERGVPLRFEGRVRCITNGRFVVTGPMFHGVEINMGRTAVLDTGGIQLVVSERRVEPFDLGVFTHCGLSPQTAKYVLLHSRQHFRAGFEPVAASILMVSGPGVCTSDYDSLPFKRLTRPIYPLDPDTQWPVG
tara:strand:+ start:1429 stop:2937 length:1509 start_codon:yes stop_codon:yes gene_type:complete